MVDYGDFQTQLEALRRPGQTYKLPTASQATQSFKTGNLAVNPYLTGGRRKYPGGGFRIENEGQTPIIGYKQGLDYLQSYTDKGYAVTGPNQVAKPLGGNAAHKVTSDKLDPASSFWGNVSSATQAGKDLGMGDLSGLLAKGSETDVALAQGLISDYGNQIEAAQRITDQYDLALDYMTDRMASLHTTLDGLATSLSGRLEEVGNDPDLLEAKRLSLKYVQDSTDRMQKALHDLDEIARHREAKADEGRVAAMESSVAQIMASSQESERALREMGYGPGTAEWAQLQESKRYTLGATNSAIQAEWARMEQDWDRQYLQTRATTATNMATNVNFQEQLAVQTHLSVGQLNEKMRLDLLGQQVAIEQLKMSADDNYANWIINRPDPYVSSAPTLAMIADLIAG